MKVQYLLLLQWCRIHHEERSEIYCIPCQNEVTKLMSPIPCEDTDYDIAVEAIKRLNHEKLILQRDKITIEEPQPEQCKKEVLLIEIGK